MTKWNPDEAYENVDFDGALGVLLGLVGRRVEVSIDAGHHPYGGTTLMAAVGTLARAKDILDTAGDDQREVLWFSFAEWEDERSGFFLDRSRFVGAETPSENRGLLAVTLEGDLRLVVKLV